MNNKYKIGVLPNYPQVRFLKQFLVGHPGIIAGGCFKSLFLGESVRDIDMFFRNETDYKIAVEYFKDHEAEYEPGYTNNNVESFIHLKTQTRIECIRKIYGTPEKLLDQFDFTIAKFAYEVVATPQDAFDDHGLQEWNYEDSVLYHPDFFEHLHLKRLVVDDVMPYPVSTFNRAFKYAKAGFIPCRKTKLKILKEIQRLPSTPEDDQLAGAMYEGHD